MTHVGAPARPVSDALARELLQSVRQHQLVLWFDPEGHYTRFVDRLATQAGAGAPAYALCAFRGSYMELMLTLAPLTAGADPPSLLLHLPGLTHDALATTPLLELRETGRAFERPLTALITDAAAGQVRPEQIAAFTAEATATLEGADAWLAAQLDGQATGFAASLHALTPLALLEDLINPQGQLAARLRAAEAQDQAWHRLGTAFGLTDAWRSHTAPQAPAIGEDMAFAAASWCLAVEYVFDLTRPPHAPLLQPARALPAGVRATCCEVASSLRQRNAAYYRRTAHATEDMLASERAAAVAADLGTIDTFRFEERTMLDAVLAALDAQAWDFALESAERRTRGDSFWLADEPARASAWHLIEAAARLGNAIDNAGPRLGPVDTLDAAVARYRTAGAAVDRAHRHLEQRRAVLLYPQLPAFERLLPCLDGMRAHWRTWADAWARDFNQACRALGFVPQAALQQRALFDDVVRPRAQEAGLTAYVLVDAMRYEMAEELRTALASDDGTTAQLDARLAELPTITAVGMNALAPVANAGKLRPVRKDGAIQGFAAGEFRVTSPAHRQRAMHERVGGTTCPWLSLDEVLNRSTAALKNTLSQARLVVVHSLEIDTAGENGVGPISFDQTLQDLRGACHRLREMGARRLVITSDHGFLLLDDQPTGLQDHGRTVDPQRRHVFSGVAADHAGEARVALADLGYESAEGYLMLPETTAVFNKGGRPPRFVHGGNSLQERVIPVLTLTHDHAGRPQFEKYQVEASVEPAVAGMHCLAITARVAAGGGLGFTAATSLDLALRVPLAPGVHVELCDTRGGATLAAGAVNATVGERFELFFRLTGPADARVAVELYHPSRTLDVEACTPATFFEVTASRAATANPPPDATPPPQGGWSQGLPEGGVRQLFEHLFAHGVLSETEATTLLGGARAMRRFATEFDGYLPLLPFPVRMEVVGGVKRFVRDGGDA